MFKKISLIGLTALFMFSVTALSAEKRYAVIFGSNYKNNQSEIPPLDLCEKDAELIKKSLLKHGKYDEVRVFLGKNVTAANVKKTLADLAKKVKEGDSVIMHFSGHGVYQRDADAPNGIRNTIVMYDRPHITDKQLNDWLSKIKTTKFLWIFDCCYSGGIIKKGRKSRRPRGAGDIPVGPDSKAKVIEDGAEEFYFQNKALVSSSDANETAIEIGGSINQGLFTYYFAKGMSPRNGDLNKDKQVTALEAFEWAAARVAEEAKKYNHEQHPQVSGNASGIYLAGKVRPIPPKPDPDPPVVDPPKPDDKPTPSPVKPEPSPITPDDPVTPDEPDVVVHTTQTDVVIYTTILQSNKAGINMMDPRVSMHHMNTPRKTRRISVTVSGKNYETKVKWVDRRGLRRLSGEDVPMGYYEHNGTEYKNRMAVITLKSVPTGVHEIAISADDYPVIKRRLGVEKDRKRNKSFIVASVAGSGTIQGKVFYKDFDHPVKGHNVVMPTVTTTNQNHEMRTLKDGSFWFMNLPPGDFYFIKASFLESLPLDGKYFKIKSGDVTKIDVVLKVRGGF